MKRLRGMPERQRSSCNPLPYLTRILYHKRERMSSVFKGFEEIILNYFGGIILDTSFGVAFYHFRQNPPRFEPLPPDPTPKTKIRQFILPDFISFFKILFVFILYFSAIYFVFFFARFMDYYEIIFYTFRYYFSLARERIFSPLGAAFPLPFFVAFYPDYPRRKLLFCLCFPAVDIFF